MTKPLFPSPRGKIFCRVGWGGERDGIMFR